jgi:hypothetical protein
MLLTKNAVANRRQIDWLLPCLVALALIGIGVWLHIGFSLEAGELVFFKNAYDEDTYALFTVLSDQIRLDRLLSAWLTVAFRNWTGGYDLAFVLADAFLPAAAFVSCWYLVGRLYRAAEYRVFWALLILFSPDLFSLGSAASPTARLYAFSSFKAIFGDLGSVLVPPIETSYLNILRSFEPQLAYVAGFLFVGLLVRVVLTETGRPHWGALVSLGLAHCLILVTYSIVSYPLLALEFYAALILFVAGSLIAASVLLAYFLVSLAIVVYSASLVLDGPNLVVASHLPSIGTSTIGAVGLCLVIAFTLVKYWFSGRRLWLALGFAGLPVVLINQQVITGVMVSNKDWERYINHPLLLIGAAIFFSDPYFRTINPQPAVRLSLRVVSALLVLGMLIFAVDGTLKTRDYWISLNDKSLAIARAIEARPDLLGGDTQLLLDETSLAPLVAIRNGSRLNFLIDYTNVFTNWIPSSTEASYRVPKTGVEMFEYWRLSAKTPEAVEELLRSEAQSRAGFYSGFFFNLCDYWYPCTDNRAVKSELIQVLIGKVVEAYEAYLSDHTDGGEEHYLLITTTPVPGPFDRNFSPVPVASASAGQAVAYVFEQASD